MAYLLHVGVCARPGSERFGIPVELDNSILMSSLRAKFPGVVGLEYIAKAGKRKTVLLDGPTLCAPRHGWTRVEEYYCIFNDIPKAVEPTITSTHLVFQNLEYEKNGKTAPFPKIVEGKREGHGKWIYTDGSFYIGNWKHDKRHGKGICFYINGSRYEGDWKRDKRFGFGVFTDRSWTAKPEKDVDSKKEEGQKGRTEAYKNPEPLVKKDEMTIYFRDGRSVGFVNPQLPSTKQKPQKKTKQSRHPLNAVNPAPSPSVTAQSTRTGPLAL